MSDNTNPYQSPGSESVQLSSLEGTQGKLTEKMLVFLKGASPWLRFVGVLGFIASAMMAFWGLASFALIPLFGQITNELDDIAFSAIPFMGFIISGTLGIFILGFAVLAFFPSLFTYRFGDKIRKYLQSGKENDLEEAFKNNKSLWKFIGIICIIYLAFIPLVLVISIIGSILFLFL